MHQQPQGQSIWGTINTCIEIALDVYAIIAKDRDGNEQQGIMVKHGFLYNRIPACIAICRTACSIVSGVGHAAC